jgi:hypothetical protein
MSTTKRAAAVAKRKAAKTKGPTQAKAKPNKEPEIPNISVQVSELRSLSATARRMIVAAAETSKVFGDPNMASLIEDKEPLIAAGEALSRDLKSLLARIDGLDGKVLELEQHGDEMSGVLDSIMIAEDYQQWMFDYTESVQPTVDVITEYIEQIEASGLQGAAKPTAEATESPIGAEGDSFGGNRTEVKQATPVVEKQPVAEAKAPAQTKKKSDLDLMALATGGARRR